MALLAKQRTCRDQELFVIGAVRLVAIAARIPHRCVVEQERATLVRMAPVTGFVDTVRLQQRLGRAAVRIVAIRARNLPFR